ncbi:DUF1045 domain-containing protein [Tropicimonas sp. S265A]|uniref:DUF1045 domain-containing protein n=1 Tax=Tropicimonas sp. S265A TaxID=3415134 RepID=UPI003C7EB087
MSFTRFAIYYLPTDKTLASFGAAWLGWDVCAGRSVAQPDVGGIGDVTATPRKYGFHGTLKPPFRVCGGVEAAQLEDAVAALAERTAPARCDGLALSRLGRFLALTPIGDASEIGRVAAACVSDLDTFRAPPTMAELARRRRARLSPLQEAMLTRWGYPYVMDAFRFHLTLTGTLPDGTARRWQEVVADALPPLPAPFVMDEIALVGERPDGMFERIQRYALTG